MKEIEFLKTSLPKLLAEAESAKLSGNYVHCIELYVRAANIFQKLGNLEEFVKYTKLAKELRFKLMNTDTKSEV